MMGDILKDTPPRLSQDHLKVLILSVVLSVTVGIMAYRSTGELNIAALAVLSVWLASELLWTIQRPKLLTPPENAE